MGVISFLTNSLTHSHVFLTSLQMHVEIRGGVLPASKPLPHGPTVPERWLVQGEGKHRGWYAIVRLFLPRRIYSEPLRDPARERVRLVPVPERRHLQFEVSPRIRVHLRHWIHR